MTIVIVIFIDHIQRYEITNTEENQNIEKQIIREWFQHIYKHKDETKLNIRKEKELNLT